MFKKIISPLIYLSVLGAFNSHAEECQSITQLENSRTNTGSIYTSGKHCLDYDILQKEYLIFMQEDLKAWQEIRY